MLSLDSTTVIATAAFVAGMSGAFLLVAGGKLRTPPPATIWGVSNLFTAIGMMLVLQGANYDLAFLSLMMAGALTWIAVASFERKDVPLTYLVAGPAIWAIAMMGPWQIDFGVGAVLFLTITAGYFGACAWQLWQGRGEELPARWPVLSLVVANAFAVLIAAVELAGFRVAPSFPPGGALWVIYVSTVIFTIGTAVFFLAMTKERQVVVNEYAALTDSLTGLANRHALMASGSVAIKKAQANGRPLAVAVFDLDHFKTVNDTYGHRTGDTVLQRFAETARKCMRGSDLFGRVGGEEFVAIVPGARATEALAFAERVRVSFAGESVWIDGKPVCATVSSGVAVMEPGDDVEGLDQLLERADAALYVAKASGRDCVSISRTSNMPQTGPLVDALAQ